MHHDPACCHICPLGVYSSHDTLACHDCDMPVLPGGWAGYGPGWPRHAGLCGTCWLFSPFRDSRHRTHRHALRRGSYPCLAARPRAVSTGRCECVGPYPGACPAQSCHALSLPGLRWWRGWCIRPCAGPASGACSTPPAYHALLRYRFAVFSHVFVHAGHSARYVLAPARASPPERRHRSARTTHDTVTAPAPTARRLTELMGHAPSRNSAEPGLAAMACLTDDRPCLFFSHPGQGARRAAGS